MVKKVGKYEMGRTLGEGTFGKVKYAINTETNEAVAIKVLDKERIQKQNMGNQIKKEISIMKMVIHKYVVGLIEVLASKTKIFIVLELVTGGELFNKIVSSKRLSEQQAKFYFAQLVEGVEYCHKLGVCHRDLKPENLLLDENGNLKISDFGLSSLYVGDAEANGASRTELLHTTCGTPNYVSPEVLADAGYDGKKADVWSIGVILYVLIAGFLPFDESTIQDLFKKIQKAEFTYPSWFSPEVREVLDLMLIVNPKQRISLSQLREHPWLKPCYASTETATGAEAAVAGVTETDSSSAVVAQASVAGVSEEDGGMHEAEDVDDDDDEDSVNQPRPLNAFDLVSHCGGFKLDCMFSPHTFCSLESPVGGNASASASAAPVSPRAAGIIQFGTMTKKSTSFQFPSSLAPVALIQAVHAALTDIGFTFHLPADKIMASCKLRGEMLTAKGMLSIGAQVFYLCPTLSLLEIRRGKGDLLEWSNIFKDLTQNRLKSLLHMASAEGEGKQDSATV